MTKWYLYFLTIVLLISSKTSQSSGMDSVVTKPDPVVSVARQLVKKYQTAKSFTCTVTVKALRNYHNHKSAPSLPESSLYFVALQRPNLAFICEWRTTGNPKRNTTRQFICDGSSWLLTDSQFPMQYQEGSVEGSLSSILEKCGYHGGSHGDRAIALFENLQRGFWNQSIYQSALLGSASAPDADSTQVSNIVESLQHGSTKKINDIPVASLIWNESIPNSDWAGNPILEYKNEQIFYVAQDATLLRVRGETFFSDSGTVKWTEEYSNIAFNRDLPKSYFHVTIPTGWKKVQKLHEVK